jgi:hypothetical protein
MEKQLKDAMVGFWKAFRNDWARSWNRLSTLTGGHLGHVGMTPTTPEERKGGEQITTIITYASIPLGMEVGGEGEALPADDIMFSQKSVNGLDDITASMSANGWVGAPVDVVRMEDGTMVTLDNTRVLAASQAGIDVQAVVHQAGDALPPSQIQRFTTSAGAPSTWGQAAQYRIQNQGVGFSGAYPNGSPVTGVK